MLIRLNDTDFYQTLASSRGPALVFFSGSGCSSCRYWRTLLTQLTGPYDTLPVFEVDAGESMGLTREYGVFHLPALFVFRDGQFHAPLECEANLATISATLDALLAQPAQEAP